MSDSVMITLITVIGGGMVTWLVNTTSNFKKIMNQLNGLQQTIEEVQRENEQQGETIKKVSLAQEEIKAGTRQTQRYRLQHDMNKALLRGSVSHHELAEVSALYDSYQRLGGNGSIKTLYERFKQLPIRKEEEAWNN